MLLQYCGIRDDLLIIIQSFLANQKQPPILNGMTSDWGSFTANVIQGSVLGPLFFLLYINALTEDPRCNAKPFADDAFLSLSPTMQTPLLPT